ncbi:MAG: alcohol dehydrogenase catalytic domain-containing protein [Candidatus Dormibacteraceae bacterium]
MRAMAITDYERPLELMSVDQPTPPRGYALVAVDACGLCFSDVKTMRGHMRYSDTLALPFVPGHEVAGHIVDINGESDLKAGARVLVHHLWPCHRCPACRRGDEHLCYNPRAWMGFTHPGGFQEFVAAPLESLMPLPDGIDMTVAPALTCAMGTAYRAVTVRGRVRVGDVVVVVGMGGVGLHAALIAQAAGAEVVGVDLPAKLAGAHAAGVGRVVAPDDALEMVRSVTGGDAADVVIESSGVPSLLDNARKLTRSGGTIVGVGYQVGKLMTVMSDPLVLTEMSLVGSRYASRSDLEHVVRLVANGHVKPVIDDVLPLERLNEAVSRLEAGEVTGRLVMDLRVR